MNFESKEAKKAEKASKTRDWSALLPLVLILMLLSAIVGLVASAMNLSNNSKVKTINEYVESSVIFSVVGYGEYTEYNPSTVFEIYASVTENETMQNLLVGKTYNKTRDNLIQVYSFENPDENLLGELIDIAGQCSGAVYSLKYTCKDAQSCITYAYDDAYNEALAKATQVAGNTGKTWRITNVEEVDTTFDASTGVTKSTVRMSFSVNDK